LIHFTVYSRSYCHLCDDMLAALQAMQIPGSAISVVDVDSDEHLLAQYDELVPVLTARADAQPEQRLCHYFLDEAAVRAFVDETNMARRFRDVEANLRLSGGDPSGDPLYENIKARMIKGDLTAEEARREIFEHFTGKPSAD
jgi:hypothetical protein